jgi:ADP-heptose:LPS heptosyltransferase
MLGATELDWYGSAWVDRLEDIAPVIAESDVTKAAWLLTAADGYIGNDAGMTHVAAAIGVPTVALFGPTEPDIWCPLGPHVRVVRCGADFALMDPDRVVCEVLAAVGAARA